MKDSPNTSIKSSPETQKLSIQKLETSIVKIRQSLRPGQTQMADWTNGELAVSAVPGAGKSTGMAAAATIAIARQYQHNYQTENKQNKQLIVVTFTRSATANIKAKIQANLKQLSLPPTGFTVYTLHGLALNIANRYPNLSGLQLENAKLITPNQTHKFIRDAVERWIIKHRETYNLLLSGKSFDGEETEKLRRQSVLNTEILPDLAYTVIHEAKSSGLLPQQLQNWSQQTSDKTVEKYNILFIAAGLYAEYQQIMELQEFIDYDDMILGALKVLKNDTACQIEQGRILAVFEDEAQDSSPLQTELLEILAGKKYNYLPTVNQQLNIIRVGDPNQAINSTFTPADPIYFREFCQQCETKNRLAKMTQAGRSTQIIIDAANFTLHWVNSQFKHQQNTPFTPQNIQPVNQENGNPQPIGKGLEIYIPRDIHHTVELLGKRIIELFKQDGKEFQGAILVRENRQGRWLANALAPICQQQDLKLYDVGERERRSHVPQEMLSLLQFCDRPHSPEYLKSTLQVLVNRELIPTQDINTLASLPEEFLYPSPLSIPQTEIVKQAGHLCRSLLKAYIQLPLYQIISFFALTLKYDSVELATADKLAEKVNQQMFGNNSIERMLLVLNEVVNSEKFEPVETEDLEAKYVKKGQITIITMHKAKGLDWNYVFLPFLHENLIPGTSWIPPQIKFLGDFSLSEIARAQIRAGLHQKPIPYIHEAWEQARFLKIAEEYRLFYVAMTRAKKLLWLSAAEQAPFTWSKPENLQSQTPSPIFLALKKQFSDNIIR